MTVGEFIDDLLAKMKAGDITTDTPVANLSECASCYGAIDEDHFTIEVGKRTTQLPAHKRYDWGQAGQVIETKVESQEREIKTLWIKSGEVVLDSSRRLPEEPIQKIDDDHRGDSDDGEF